MVRVAVLDTNGSYRLETVPDELATWQGLVGGLIGFTATPALVPAEGGFQLIHNDDGNPNLQPNLWGPILGVPMLGPMVLVREKEHDCKADLTDDDVAMLNQIRHHLRVHFIELGLIPDDSEPNVIAWSGDWPGDSLPGP